MTDIGDEADMELLMEYIDLSEAPTELFGLVSSVRVLDRRITLTEMIGPQLVDESSELY